MDPKEFGAILKKLRNNKGLTLTELGNKIGYSNPYLSQIETGKKGIPQPELLHKIASALEIDHTYLMFLAGYLYDTEFTKEKEAKLEEDFHNLLGLGAEYNLYDILTSSKDTFYKDKLLTKEEKQKLLTIIETVLG
ncbi:helix-turn-helix domain-containing protein [Lentibacillus saliphilus]|uniref:helix-turn-helix domain-containing protein n=1 Tax=Lentibacillus saliphilus TaxID=2737028 RepID=UPI001C2FB558|nr:helix-turn-helix transcriptional regulator [Lentibacillus saliphilus]